MDERVDTMLDEALMKHLEELNKATPGSEDARRIVDDFVELQKLALDKQKAVMDSEKQDADRDLAREKAEAEVEAKEEERKMLRKQNIIQAAIQGGGVALTAIGTFLGIAYTNKHVGEVLKFEQDGYISSTVGKSLLGSIFRRK